MFFFNFGGRYIVVRVIRSRSEQKSEGERVKKSDTKSTVAIDGGFKYFV